jgi:hypothetical protein
MARQMSDQTLKMMAFIKKVVDAEAPVTQRHLFYRCVDQGFIEKDSAGEDKVASVIFHMRWGVSRTNLRGNRYSHLPEPTIPDDLRLDWHDVVDETRDMDSTATWESVGVYLSGAADRFRLSALDHADRHVEVWVEKDALKSILWPVCMEYDVPLVSTRGQPSHPLMHDLAMRIVRKTGSVVREIGSEDNDPKPVTLLVLTDYDPSGQVIAENFKKVLTDFFRLFNLNVDRVMSELTITHLALTRALVDRYKLPTRPTKRGTNTHAQSFGDNQSVELDAMSPNTLRSLLRKAIERHIPQTLVKKVRAKEDKQRRKLEKIAEAHT